MESKDGKDGFDFTGHYTRVEPNKQLEYTMDDDRRVQVSFIPDDIKTRIIETFEAEETNSLELQHSGWQSILDNFKKYAENTGRLNVIHFKISINAPVEKVYKVMLDEEKYKEWTSEFNPTSTYSGTWEVGSKMLFLGTDKDGKTGGMVSRIKENIPNKYVSIEHLGTIQDGEELTGEENTWAGSLENYCFEEEDGVTILSVDMDSNEEFESYFNETWPRALKRLKSICETR
jgi:uncharacterized protein YndB with AHSA1/START domain